MKVEGFKYVKQPYRFVATFKDGKWDEGVLSTEANITINEGSTALHYGQQCFEGLKAFKTPDGKVNLFRPEMNAKRMNESCERLLMPEIPEELFIKGCIEAVKANIASVPDYGEGASLYLRPFMIGVGENLGVKAAPEYMFIVFVSPVGAYFANGFKPVRFCTSKYDRAATYGTGRVKVGGNYAASFLPNKEAKEKGYADCIYLDPKTHTKIEEVGAANFFGITANNEFVTPCSESILNSITKRSLMEIAERTFKMTVIEGDCYVDELNDFEEVGACGTAAVITPIYEIEHNGTSYTFGSPDKAGEMTTKLYNKLVDIQYGIDSDYSDWLVEVK